MAKVPSVLHANEANVVVRGVVVGVLQNLTARISTGADYVYGIGSGEPQEINHNRKSYNISATALHLRRGQQSEIVHQFPTELGELEGMQIEFIDKNYGTQWVAFGCEPHEQNFNARVNARTDGGVQFMALGIRPGTPKPKTGSAGGTPATLTP